MVWTSERKRQTDKDYYARNREERKAYVRQYNLDNPDKRLGYKLKEFGLTVKQYRAMLEAQGNKCAICRCIDPGKKRWAVDHDHNTGKVRGLLCSACNTGLGHFADDPETMQAAIEYLKKHTGNT